jgi:DNA-binding response OmpR family regulator
MVEDSPDILKLNESVVSRFFKRNVQIYKTETMAQTIGLLFDVGQDIDVILLDLNLPDGNALDLLPEIRRLTNASVIVLSARNTKADIVQGLMSGGDDYITKPYDTDELCARILAAVRRSQSKRNIFKSGRVKLDAGSFTAYMDGENLTLTPKEFSILMTFMENEGKVLSPAFIYESVWKTPMNGDSAALIKHISNLKSKLEKGDMVSIMNIRGRGYIFEISRNFYTPSAGGARP